MKKYIYIFSILAFAALAILGAAGNAYVEHYGPERMTKRYLFVILPLTILIGTIIIYFIPRLFPGAIPIKKWKAIFLSIGLYVVVFTCTTGVFLFINASVGKIEPVHIRGYVDKRWAVHSGKHDDYFMLVRDTVEKRMYEFKVKKYVFEQTGKGEVIDKVFYRGSLGVLYRYNY